MLVHLVVFIHQDDFKLLADRLSDLLETEGHRLVLVGTDVFVELLVDLVDDAPAPGFHLLVNQLHLVVELFSLVLLLGVVCDVLVELVEVGVLGLALLVKILAVAALDLEFMQLIALLLVVVP